MTQPTKTCAACLKNKDIKQFYWYKKQRTMLRELCHKCHAAWLLSDTTGKRIARAAARNEINSIYAEALHAKLAASRIATDEARKEKLRTKALAYHAHRQFLEAQYGIRTSTPTERRLFMSDPDAGAAFDRDQAQRRARYEADTAREQARRAKISAALKGKPRAPRAPSAADRLAAAARERS
jgi:hypothetical protein